MTKHTNYFHLPIAFVVDTDQKLLFLKRIDRGCWEPVKGGMEEGETPKDTLLREFHEETGLEEHMIKNFSFSGERIKTRVEGDHIWESHFYIFWIALNCPAPEISINHDVSGGVDHDDWGWFSLEEINRLSVEYWYDLGEEIREYFEK